MTMRITVAADAPEVAGFQSEFGLSLLLRTASGIFLFDTGAGTALLPNLRRMGLDAEDIRKVILSHGHYDHTGGLAEIHPEEIWCCRGIGSGHYSLHADGTVHDISMPGNARTVLDQARIHWSDTFRQIAPELLLTGPIERGSAEDCGGKFFHDPDCRIPDDIAEEQALLTSDGFLITGCCHAGLINTINHCRKHHPEIRIRAVVGGLHLRNADPARLEQTAACLRENGISEMFPMHCTGEKAIEYLRRELKECRIVSPCPGDTLTLA